jgi:hypothetical protein
VVHRQESSKPPSPLIAEHGDHTLRINVIFWSDVLTLEKQLQLGRQIGNVASTVKDGSLPFNVNPGIPAEDPTFRISLTDSQIETPRLVSVPPTPHVVLIQIGP